MWETKTQVYIAALHAFADTQIREVYTAAELAFTCLVWKPNPKKLPLLHVSKLAFTQFCAVTPGLLSNLSLFCAEHWKAKSRKFTLLSI